MDLLERYLTAVRRNLPAREADDITAELREELLERAEEREAKGGEVDWTGLLKEFGHPLTVAARYRQQQWLIGPELYPFYLHFLKLIGLIVVAVLTVTALVKGVWSPAPVGPLIVGLLGSLWWGVVATVGSVTILFVLTERYGGAAKHFRHWNPSELPDVTERQPRPGESAFEVTMGILFLLWWVGVIRLPNLAAGASFRLEMAPIWSDLYWPITALLVGRLVYNLIQWLRPRWKTARALLGAATAVGAIALLIPIYQAGEWARVVPTGMPAAEAMRLQGSLNLALGVAVVVVGIIWLLSGVGELWRLGRRLREVPVARETHSTAP